MLRDKRFIYLIAQGNRVVESYQGMCQKKTTTVKINFE